MEIMEIMKDALVYPLNNLKALIIYIILGIILGVAVVGTVVGVMASASANNVLAAIGSGIIGIIIAVFIGFVISGYELDIIKYGIERNDRAPGVDIVRQFKNGVKLFAVNIVYFLIPIIISAILAVIFQHWLSAVISTLLFILFGLAAIMGQCRLAKSEDLIDALAVGESIGDVSRVGIVKLILFIIVVVIIIFILYLIVGFISQWNQAVGGTLMGILGVYITFFIARATGLLYSEV